VDGMWLEVRFDKQQLVLPNMVDLQKPVQMSY
jgi:hypothetical protein